MRHPSPRKPQTFILCRFQAPELYEDGEVGPDGEPTEAPFTMACDVYAFGVWCELCFCSRADAPAPERLAATP